MDKTPLPGPGDGRRHPARRMLTLSRSASSVPRREPIRVKPTPEDTEERKKFGYCRFGQVLADTNPELGR